MAAILAWSAGVATYQASAHFAPRLGATVPTLAVTAVLYWVARSGGIDGAFRRPRTAPDDTPHRA
jgi:hypothetical protein